MSELLRARCRDCPYTVTGYIGAAMVGPAVTHMGENPGHAIEGMVMVLEEEFEGREKGRSSRKGQPKRPGVGVSKV